MEYLFYIIYIIILFLIYVTTTNSYSSEITIRDIDNDSGQNNRALTYDKSYLNINKIKCIDDKKFLNCKLSFNEINQKSSTINQFKFGVLIDSEVNLENEFNPVEYGSEYTINLTTKHVSQKVNEKVYETDQHNQSIIESPISNLTEFSNNDFYYTGLEQIKHLYFRLNLTEILSPIDYNIIFYTSYNVSNGNNIVDYIGWIHFPSYEINIFTDPSVIQLYPKENVFNIESYLDLYAKDSGSLLIKLKTNENLNITPNLTSPNNRYDIKLTIKNYSLVNTASSPVSISELFLKNENYDPSQSKVVLIPISGELIIHNEIPNFTDISTINAITSSNTTNSNYALKIRPISIPVELLSEDQSLYLEYFSSIRNYIMNMKDNFLFFVLPLIPVITIITLIILLIKLTKRFEKILFIWRLKLKRKKTNKIIIIAIILVISIIFFYYYLYELNNIIV